MSPPKNLTLDLGIRLVETSLDELIAEAEYHVDHWANRIGDMILLHIRRTGKAPNTVWLPRRFYDWAFQSVMPANMVLLPDVGIPFVVRNVDSIPSRFGGAINPEDLAVGYADEGTTGLKIESFFVERNCGPQVV